LDVKEKVRIISYLPFTELMGLMSYTEVYKIKEQEFD